MTDLSVVFFSYNRTGYLAQTIYDFLRKCTFPRKQMQLIISDDGSKTLHIDQLTAITKKFGVDNLLLLKHMGMGNSFNAGIKDAQGEYILHLQDDWSLTHDDGFIEKAIGIISANQDIAMVRLAMLGNSDTPFNPAGQKKVKYSVGDIKVPAVDLSNDLYVYSDNPHIKSARFHREFGWYRENVHPEITEKDMCHRFNSQRQWRITWIGEYFRHIGQFSATPGRNWPDTMRIPIHFDPDIWKGQDV
jgi:glycosyltransferase involved in cell wall biosynthesis